MDTNKNVIEEHVMVCLSPSPSNCKIITIGAQMAKAFSMAVEGGRIAYNSKFGTVSRDANASSPLTGFLE